MSAQLNPFRFPGDAGIPGGKRNARAAWREVGRTTPIDLDGDGANDIDSTEQELKSVQDRLARVDQDVDRKSALLDEETRQGVVKVGGQQTTGIAGCGSRCRELQAAIKLDREQRADLEQRQGELDAKLKGQRGSVSGQGLTLTSNVG